MEGGSFFFFATEVLKFWKVPRPADLQGTQRYTIRIVTSHEANWVQFSERIQVLTKLKKYKLMKKSLIKFFRTFQPHHLDKAKKVTNINLLNPTGSVMRQQFNIQQLYILPTLYLCVLYLSENKQRHVPLTA